MPQNKILSTICFYAGFASIIGSILIWAFAKGDTPATLAHAERFGVFVGLWAPTFFILSSKFSSPAIQSSGQPSGIKYSPSKGTALKYRLWFTTQLVLRQP